MLEMLLGKFVHTDILQSNAYDPVVQRVFRSKLICLLLIGDCFIRSPELLDAQLRLKSRPSIRFAGQITGCEGYVESAAIGLLAGRFAAAELAGGMLEPPPPTTARRCGSRSPVPDATCWRSIGRSA